MHLSPKPNANSPSNIMDTFFTKTTCDRCHRPLTGGRTMSMFNTECICMDCAASERKRADYQEAVEAERSAVRNGNRKHIGIDSVNEKHNPVK